MIRRRSSKCGDAQACHNCSVRKGTEWALLEGEQLADLDCARIESTYMADEIVFRRGDPCEGLFCVRSGILALWKSNSDGASVITRLVHAGETLGYRTLFAGGRFASTAIPITEARLCFIPSEVVWGVLEEHPPVSRRFLKHLSQKLMVAEDNRLERSALSMRARLAGILLELGDRLGTDDGEDGLTFELPLTRQDLAAMLGVRPESVTRAIRSLGEAGLALVSGRRVSIPSVHAIAQESGLR